LSSPRKRGFITTAFGVSLSSISAFTRVFDALPTGTTGADQKRLARRRAQITVSRIA
jgi:hypothetical protein